MLFYILCSIRKRRVKNLITIGISMALVILLSLYFGNIHSYQKQLDDFAENVPIYCQITNKNGSRETGLFISDDIVQGIQNSDLVKDETCMVWLMAGEGDFEPKDWAGNINLWVHGANRAEAVPGLAEDGISLEQGTPDAFFSSDKLTCLVKEDTLARRGWKVGDKILLNFFFFTFDNATMGLSCYTNPLELAEVEIVGTMKEGNITTAAVFSDIVLPFETVRAMYQREEVAFLADTVSFSVKDPLKLNEFKEKMKGLGLQEKDLAAMDSYSGISLAVKDGNFISMASDLRQAIEYMEAFLPIVILMVLLIGYVVSNLLGGSRMEEYILLRLQGAGRWKSAVGFWSEQMFLVWIGIVTGDILVGLFYPEPATIALVTGILVTAYLAGAAVAYWRMSRGSVMQLLSGKA
ncbi:MAG: hypothetical protein Q4C77_03395 [Eubacteriales bacterium]|nr:hypothetical protein [Eubacteriales bacterium]